MCDLKTENVLMKKNGYLKLADFGLAEPNVKRNNIKEKKGTPSYMSPELVKGKKYGKPLDWWCVGIIIYEMIFGFNPFMAETEEALN